MRCPFVLAMHLATCPAALQLIDRQCNREEGHEGCHIAGTICWEEQMIYQQTSPWYPPRYVSQHGEAK